MSGMMLRLIGTLLAGIFLEEMSKWVWLGLVMPVTGLSGGLATFVLVIYSFASDNSSARFCNLYSIHMVYVFYIFDHFRDRYVRIAVAGWMWDLAYFIAMPLGAWLYNTGGYVLNFGTAVIIYAFACFIGLVKLRGFKEKIKKHDLTLKGKSIN